MPEVFVNKYPSDPSTVTTGALTSTDTSIPVPSTAAYSATGQFRVLLDESVTPEYALVTVGDGTHLTTVGGTAGRGIEGTPAASHLSGATVVAVLTAGGLGNISATQRVVVDLTAAQLHTLDSAPVELVAAPGEGKAIIPSFLLLESHFGTTSFGSGFTQLVGGPVYHGDGGILIAVGPAFWFGVTSIVYIAAPPGHQAESNQSERFVANNAALDLATTSPLDAGAVATSTVAAGGAGYSIGDSFQIDGAGLGDAGGTVDTVDGGGAVLTYHLTALGTDYSVQAGASTLSGPGAGLTINIDSITLGDGTLRVTLDYEIVTLA